MAYLLNYKQFNLDEDTEEQDFGGRNEDKVIRSVFLFPSLFLHPSTMLYQRKKKNLFSQLQICTKNI